MKKNGFQRVLATMALFSLTLILALAGCADTDTDENSGGNQPVVEKVTIVRPVNPGIAFVGEVRTLTYQITVTGSAKAFPINLTSGNVLIGVLNDGKVESVPGISISELNVTGSGVQSQFKITVSDRFTFAQTLDVVVSIRGVISNEERLFISPKSLVSAITVVPADPHGEVFAGTRGELKYMITVTGDGAAFPINYLNSDIVVFTIGDEPLPSGISPEAGTITESGVATPLSFIVDMPAGKPADYPVSVAIHSRPINDPFTITVKPAALFGDVFIRGYLDGNTLTADTDALPGDGNLSYQWQRSTNQTTWIDIDGANDKTYTIAEADFTLYIRVLVYRGGFIEDIPVVGGPVGPIPDSRDPPIQGTVTVTGTVRVDQTLTASVSGLSGGAVAIYHWQHSTENGYETISGTSGSTYTVRPADVGRTIRAAVTSLGFRDAIYSTATAVVPAHSVAAQLNELRGMSNPPGAITVTANDNESIAPQELSFNGRTIEITIRSASTANVLQLTHNGAMFTVKSGVTLKLENIELRGLNNNNRAVIVNEEGTLIINSGTKITGNNNTETTFMYMGGGVNNMGLFYMNDGSITGNTAVGGGGVANLGGFELVNGTISGNTAWLGGGVLCFAGLFYMQNGIISGNSATSHGGGGVLVCNSGEFALFNGEITNNTTSNNVHGAGVLVIGTVAGGTSTAFFEMYGGKIYNNRASGNTSEGGGVANMTDGWFFMYDGEISGNSSGYGGGVSTWNAGWFAMIGGEIAANTARANNSGGGVESYNGYFFIEGGLIHGSDAAASLRNVAGPSGYAALGGDGNLRRGTFTNDYNSFNMIGNLPVTNYTLNVRDGMLLSPISPTGMTLTNIPSGLIGTQGRISMRNTQATGGVWLSITGAETMITGTSQVFDWSNWNVPMTTYDFRVDFWRGATHEVRYEGTQVLPLLVPGNSVTLSINSLTAIDPGNITPDPRVTSITVTNIPSKYLGRGGVVDLLYFTDDLYEIEADVAINATVTFTPSFNMVPGQWELILGFYYSGQYYESMYITLADLVNGANTLSYNSFINIDELSLSILPSFNMQSGNARTLSAERLSSNKLTNRVLPGVNWMNYKALKSQQIRSDLRIQFNNRAPVQRNIRRDHQFMTMPKEMLMLQPRVMQLHR